jgi:tetratricopeptide (TPR) repeat protein
MKRVLVLFLILITFKVISQNYVLLNTLKQDIIDFPNDTLKLKNFYNELGSNKDKLVNDSLLKYFKFIYIASDKINFDRITANVCYQLGNLYNGTGEYQEALKYLFKAEKLYEKLNDYVKLAMVYGTIGNTYLGLKNNNAQKEFYYKQYNLALKINDLRGQAYGSGGLANFYSSVKDYHSAIKWGLICIKLFKEQKNYFGYVIILSNLSGYYRVIGDYDKAKENLKLAEQSLKDANLKYASFVYYLANAEQLSVEKNYNEAIKNLKLGLKLMIEDKAKHNISEAYKVLSRVSYEAKLYKESTDFLNLHLLYKDSVFNETTNKQLLDVQEKYETEKKNAQIKVLNSENDLNRVELNRKKTLIYSGLAVTALLLVLFVFVIKSNIQKNKTNKILKEQTKIIETKQKEILDSINYAGRIQKTILPSEKYIEKSINKNS